MKSSMILAASGAALGLAGLVPRDTYTQVEVVYQYVTVTAGAAAPTPVQEKKPDPSPEYEVHYYTVTEGYKPKETPKYETKPSSSKAAAPPPASTSKAAAASPTQGYASSPTDLASSAEYHHNLHRSNHTSPSVKWSQSLADAAAECAKACDMNHNLAPGGGGYGQNLASWGTSESIDGITDASAVFSAISDMWYAEFGAYDGYWGKEPGGSFEQWGHLTQLLWAGTQEIGCAVARCPKGTMYDGFNAVEIVCNYSPAGNVGGGYASNVGAPHGAPAIHN